MTIAHHSHAHYSGAGYPIAQSQGKPISYEFVAHYDANAPTCNHRYVAAAEVTFESGFKARVILDGLGRFRFMYLD